MDLDKVINSVTPEVYANLKKAVELGKWDNGLKLTKEQVENSLQIIIAYDARHKAESERVGYVAPKPAKKPQSQSGSLSGDENEWQTLSIQTPAIKE